MFKKFIRLFLFMFIFIKKIISWNIFLIAITPLLRMVVSMLRECQHVYNGHTMSIFWLETAWWRFFLSDIWFNYCFDNEIKCWTWLYFNMIWLPKHVCFNKNGIMTCIPWKCWSHFVTKKKFLQNFSKKKIANKEKKNCNIFFGVMNFH